MPLKISVEMEPPSIEHKRHSDEEVCQVCSTHLFGCWFGCYLPRLLFVVFSICLMLFLLLALVPRAKASPSQSVQSVVNTALQTGTISRQDARNIYLLKNRSWVDGSRVTVYRLPLFDDAHQGFIRDVLNMSPEQFQAEWRRLVNSGLAPEIQEVDSQQRMLSSVSRRPSAVGYLSSSYIVINMRGHDAKIITIVD